MQARIWNSSLNEDSKILLTTEKNLLVWFSQSRTLNFVEVHEIGRLKFYLFGAVLVPSSADHPVLPVGSGSTWSPQCLGTQQLPAAPHAPAFPHRPPAKWAKSRRCGSFPHSLKIHREAAKMTYKNDIFNSWKYSNSGWRSIIDVLPGLGSYITKWQPTLQLF